MIQSPIVHQPTVLNLGFLELTGFGIAVLLAFVISQIIAQSELRRRGHEHEAESIPDLILAAVLGTVIGGKLYYAVLTGDWSSLLSRAGLVFWGGLLGGIVITGIVVWRKKLVVWRIADVAGICIAAGYAIGRTGCWTVGDDYGRPWNGPLAVEFPNGAPPSTAANMQNYFGVPIAEGVAPNEVLAVHPTQLYETVMGFLMFLILWRMRNHKHAEGWLFGAYCILAGVERFIVEFFRAKDDRFFGAFTTAQLIAIGFVVAGAVIITMRSSIGNGRKGIYGEAAAA
ncbi:MAG TPA: prolipoprotein diacylglyceryl transferase [Gemmatimonadales bacterium]|nr:prolipoprotein diacylglyceryl transferase [Gemmatimonadales bacterium]